MQEMQLAAKTTKSDKRTDLGQLSKMKEDLNKAIASSRALQVSLYTYTASISLYCWHLISCFMWSAALDSSFVLLS